MKKIENVTEPVNPRTSAEHRLIIEILKRAALDYSVKLLSQDSRSAQKSAIRWVEAEIDLDSPIPFSFAWCCSQLNMCASQTRDGIREIADYYKLHGRFPRNWQ